MDIKAAPRFEIGDKVEQSYSNHGEGTVVAVFTNKAGERRYAVEMSGHRTIQIAGAGSLSAHGDVGNRFVARAILRDARVARSSG